MESLRSLVWRLFFSVLQAAVLLIWCFDKPLRGDGWLLAVSLLASLGALFLGCRLLPRIYRVLLAKWKQSVHPSREVQAERRRIANDLHDTLGSQLLQALVLMDTQPKTAADGPNPAKAVLEQSLLDLRLIVDSMDAQDDGLAMRMARLRHRLEPVMQRKGLLMHWNLSDPEMHVGRFSASPLPTGKMAHQILAVVQEGLSNALEHSQASEVWVTLEPYEKTSSSHPHWSWSLHIEDNGQGFDTESVRSNASKAGRGISNMYNRMHDIGGEIHILARVEGGTHICLRWRTPN